MARLRPAAPTIGALAVLLLLVAGCTTPAEPAVRTGQPSPVTGTSPATPAPQPVPVVVAQPASITGSEESSTMFDNFTAYVAAVDGQPVAAGRAGWNVPLSVPAGPRRLTLAFMRGVFKAQADVHFQAQAKAVYELKFATDAQVFGKNSYCEFWIVDTATGEKVLAATRVPLTKIETGK